MRRGFKILVLTIVLSAPAFWTARVVGQENSGWRISPERINIMVGEDRRLQVLDDLAQELRGASWSIDDESLAELHEENGRAVVHAKAVGTLQVTATLGQESRVSKIRIWPLAEGLPAGTVQWGGHAIGREIGDLPAVPTPDGPQYFSLEQTASGNTYLRATEEDGIQAWTWLMPENTRDVELICGDWLGGALIAAHRADSFELYTVGKDGKLHWQHNEPGLRKGVAINVDHNLYLLSESSDGSSAFFKQIDDQTGEVRLSLPLPASSETLVNLRREGSKFVCGTESITYPSPIMTTRLHVNMDSLPYLAFTQSARTLAASHCTPGSAVDSREVTLSQEDNLTLWQMHLDGTYRSTIVESMKREQAAADPSGTLAPTGAIMTDNMNGLLLPVRWPRNSNHTPSSEPAEELIYRIDPEGHVVYKLPVPPSTGYPTDEMVIVDNELGFATRGSFLIAVNITTGKELWRWDSKTPGINVVAALADRSCLVQTPTALVDVWDSTTAKEVAQGHFFIDWQGKLLRKPN